MKLDFPDAALPYFLRTQTGLVLHLHGSVNEPKRIMKVNFILNDCISCCTQGFKRSFIIRKISLQGINYKEKLTYDLINRKRLLAHFITVFYYHFISGTSLVGRNFF